MAARGDTFESSHDLVTRATAGAGAPDVGVAGAVAINIVGSRTEAYLASGSSVNANGGDVSLASVNTLAASAVATSKSEDGSKTGIGAAVAVNVAPVKTRAEIEDTVGLTGGKDLSLAATTTPTVATKAESGGLRRQFQPGWRGVHRRQRHEDRRPDRRRCGYRPFGDALGNSARRKRNDDHDGRRNGGRQRRRDRRGDRRQHRDRRGEGPDREGPPCRRVRIFRGRGENGIPHRGDGKGEREGRAEERGCREGPIERADRGAA